MRRLHDARAHVHDADTGLRRWSSRRLPVGHQVGQVPAPPGAVLGQQLVAAVRSVVADRRRGDEDTRRIAHGGNGPGEQLRRPHPAVADLPLVAVREAAGDRRPGQVDDRIGPVERCGVGPLRVPLSLIVVTRRAAHETDDSVAAGAQERAERATDQPGGTGDGDGERPGLQPRHDPVCGEVGRQLAVPVPERLVEKGSRHRGVHHVGHPRRRGRRGLEAVSVPPPQRERDELVHELVRRVVAAVLRHPTHASGEPQHGPPVAKRR